MMLKDVKKAIVAASIASIIFSAACARTPNLPVNNAFSGSWATIQVSPSYQHIGCTMKDIQLGGYDKASIAPATFESHFFVDKSDPMDGLTKLLIVRFLKLTHPKNAYVREAHFDNFKLSNNATVGITKVGDIEVPFMIKEQMSLGSQVYDFLKEKGYELATISTFYTVRFAKICSSDTKGEILFMELDNSREQIVESAKKAFAFVSQ